MVSKKILPIIVLAQFLCCSSWFAVNAVITEIVQQKDAAHSLLANVTIAVQLGFIVGALTFALYSIVDRFSPSKVFFISAIFVGLFNLILVFPNVGQLSILCSRFMVGFFLAGIYPVGMKIAADYYEKGLGKSLSFLVAALVLGTSLPHFIKAFSLTISWNYVIYATSVLTLLGGALLILWVPDGPYKKTSQKVDLKNTLDGFKLKEFKKAAIGYFGHMWELYAFWAFVPLILKNVTLQNPASTFNISLVSFFVIVAGSLACILVGYISQFFSEKKVVFIILILSCICCLLSPLFLQSSSSNISIAFLIFWGMVVIADSPLFSTLIARNAPPVSKGTSITFVTCIGFAITIVSIKFIDFLSPFINPTYLFVFLAIGPIIGLISLYNKK
jgi:MFS family permease